MSHSLENTSSTFPHSEEVLRMVGRLMAEGSQFIKALAFDAHHSHKYLREVLLGDFRTISAESLQGIEWFEKLRWMDLPQHALPRLPLKICLFGNLSVVALPGPCCLVLVAGRFVCMGAMNISGLFRIMV